MIYEIEIPKELDDVLKKVAQENNLEASVYANNIINGWLEGQYRGDVVREINKKTIEEIKSIKASLNIKPK